MSDWLAAAGDYLSLHRNEVLMALAIVLLVELVVRLGGYVTRRKHIRRIGGADEGRP